MKKIFAILIALSALSNFSCKEKEEEYTEGGLVFGGIYMLDGQQLVETDGYILELPAEQNTVELRIVSKGVQEFGIGGYPMSGLGEYKVEGFTIKVTPDPASEKLEIYDYIDVEYKGEQHRVPRYLQTLHLGADTNTGQQKEIRIRFITNIPNYWMESTHRPAGGQIKEKGALRLLFSCCKQIVPDLFVESFLRLLTSAEPAQAQLCTRLNETGPYRSTMSL